MKAAILSVGAVIAISIPLSGADGAIFTVGGPLAVSCYEAALGSGNRESDLGACTRALREEPLADQDRLATHVNRGILLMRRGRYAEADADFDAGMRIDASSPYPYLNKAFLRVRRGQGQDALPLLDKAIQLQSKRDALAYYARGIAHEQAGNLREAYADLLLARQLEPGWDMPARELARYRVRQSR